MTAHRRALVALSTAALVAGSLIIPSVSPTSAAPATVTDTYLVLADDGASIDAARDAVAAAGGQVVSEIGEIGAVIATSDRADFAAVADMQAGVTGVAHNSVVGTAPKVDAPNAESRAEADAAAATVRDDRHRDPQAEPLADLQWDMRMIHATPDGSYGEQPGRKGVLVGVIDTGIDGTHPDIAPNFSEDLSRNFVTDIEAIDGPCEDPSCVDPVNVDDGEHGTHVAGEIAAPINGIGMAGVAPNVTLVNIRAGQDSGYFFLEPTLKALVYAGEIGVDVVNMSYFTDPWLYNCQANPADTPEQQAEQRTIVRATQRAINFAHRRGVTDGRCARQREHRHRQPDHRHDQPRLPARHRVRAHDRQRDLPDDANRGQPRDFCCSHRAELARRRTTRTTGSSRTTCRHLVGSSATSSALRRTGRRKT